MLALPFILHTNELLQYHILRSFVKVKNKMLSLISYKYNMNAYFFKQNKTSIY